jgi:hypothetical protein
MTSILNAQIAVMLTIKQRLLEAIDRAPAAALESTLIFLEHRLTLQPPGRLSHKSRQHPQTTGSDQRLRHDRRPDRMAKRNPHRSAFTGP